MAFLAQLDSFASEAFGLRQPVGIPIAHNHHRRAEKMARGLVPFKTLEAEPGATFTIPAADISPRWDLMYYFEVINRDWFTRTR